ncbi:MAG TPA: SRPBCC family protein [Dermatophilaceae bacterium]|nr:SRPBCC family protein [Dermatophilaceae bacterium]
MTTAPAAYRLASRWQLGAPPDRVYAALAAVEAYAGWWPQIRRLRRLDADSGVAWVRSLLPYTLRLELRREVADAATGTLRVRVAGDLVGWCGFVVVGSGDGSVAHFSQEVDLAAPWLRRLSPAVRPLLLANHGWMLRCGRRGLERQLRKG